MEDLVPKLETNAGRFVKEHPEYNGKDIVIGILDSGVDPGLWDHPDKLVAVLDCSGSGDVHVSTECDAVWKTGQEDGAWEVVGCTGRTIRLPAKWNVCDLPTTTTTTTTTTMDSSVEKRRVRVGVLRAYDIFPAPLTKRVKEQRLKRLEETMSPLMARVRRELGDVYQNCETAEQPEQTKADLEAQQSYLEDIIRTNKRDPGPLCDCVVFWDGERYRAALDVMEDGEPQVALAQFDPSDANYGRFGGVSQFNYAIHFYREARVLSVVGCSSSHGTHVASIAAACNGGVAPGAKIVSLKITENRFGGSRDSGSAICRALMAAVRLGCHVINLSFGETVVNPSVQKSSFVRLLQRLVHEHNILFVTSASNDGPAMSTVGAPAGICPASCISVAAYISPYMMKTGYSMIDGILPSNDASVEELVGTTYTWSSVGPTTDGNNGVDLTAPGGAITSVPNWTLQKKKLMNGTSMSSPHVAGCIALLLSACKAMGIATTPNRIRRALCNTAKPRDDLNVLQQGWGLVQVEKAWDYLQAHQDHQAQDFHFDVCVNNRVGDPRGLYLRQTDGASMKHNLSVMVDPKFREEHVTDDDTQQRRIGLELTFKLEATASWVRVPDRFCLLHNGRAFKVSVDPTGLPHGVHTARVLAYDTERLDAGIMFAFPITIVKTMPKATQISLGELHFEPSEVKRYFLDVPEGAQWMDVTLMDRRDARAESAARLLCVHTLQIIPHVAKDDTEKHERIQMYPAATKVLSIRVTGGVTCEMALARFWSTVGETRIEASVHFRGVRPQPDRVQILDEGFARVHVYSDLQNESILPTAKLTKWKTPIRPTSNEKGAITPLQDERDMIPDNNNKPIYQLLNSYEFHQRTTGKFSTRIPLLQSSQYESVYESLMVMAFDANKKFLGAADRLKDEISAPIGKVHLRVQVRHEDPWLLEKLATMTVWIQRDLDKAITLKAYSSLEDLIVGKTVMKKRVLRKGCSAAVFFPTPKAPSYCKPGDVLVGTATYVSSEASLPGEGKRPNGYPVTYVVSPEASKPKSTPKAKSTPSPQDEELLLQDRLRDMQLELLPKLSKKEEFDELYQKLEHEHPHHLPLLMEGLNRARKNNTAVLEAADRVIAAVPKDELASHFGRNPNDSDPKSAETRKKMTRIKSFLVGALVAKANVYATEENKEAFRDTFEALKPWMDSSSSSDDDDDVMDLKVTHEMFSGRFGVALKMVEDAMKRSKREELLEKKLIILKTLGFEQEWLDTEKMRFKLVDHPASYREF